MMYAYVSEDKKFLINEILKIGLSKPFYRVALSTTLEAWSLSMIIRDRGVPIKSKGLYVIYADNDNGKRDCLYVGESDWCVNQRIRRFFKELAHCSHPDEEHAGARRAMQGGYTCDSHSYYVKHISWHEIYEIEKKFNINPGWSDLDEYIAHHLKSKYNTSTYPMYGYSGNTLKEFMENA